MIPKVIHYCWFGGNPLPPLAEKCIASWRKYLPDYEIRRWDEENFDVNAIPYTSQAYEAKKYAFVSDYARFWILNQHGGIYFDTDVEIIAPVDSIIAAGPFMGCENASRPGEPAASLGVNPGLGMGASAHARLCEEILDIYSRKSFIRPDGSLDQTTVVVTVSDYLASRGLVNTPDIQKVDGFTIYPKSYFSPRTQLEPALHITDKTVTIHHFAGSWLSDIEAVSLEYERKMLRVPYGIRILICKFIAFMKVKGFRAAVAQTCDRVLRPLRK